MINFDTYNNKIISTSVNNTKPIISKASVSKAIEQKKNVSENIAGKKKFIWGATALASIAIAGIAVFSGKKPQKIIKQRIQDANEIVNEIKKDSEIIIKNQKSNLTQEITDDKDIIDAETLLKNIIDKINAKVILDTDLKTKANYAYETLKNNPAELAKKIATVVMPSDKEISYLGTRFKKEEAQAVMKFESDLSFNYYLRMAPENIPFKSEIDILDKTIKASPQLEDDAYVYRAIRTIDSNNNGSVEEFAKDIKNGFILENKGYTATCRAYNDLLAIHDPTSLKLGYLMRIKLPKGTQGLDARRYTGKKNLINGYGAEFILPRNSKIKIIEVDENNKVLDCEYII